MVVGRDALDWFIPDDVPEGRCGFTTEYAHWRGQVAANNVTCWRESWDEHDQCIWHANVAGKPVDELAVVRGDSRERLDGAILRGARLKNISSFATCVLRGSNLKDADLEGVDLTDADLRWADLTEVFLGWANLTEAHLRRADLTDADLRETDLTDADLSDTTLQGVNLEGATLKETSLAGADLNEVRPASSRLLDLHLTPETDFGDRCGYDRDATEMLPAAIRPQSNGTDAIGLARLPDALAADVPVELPEPPTSWWQSFRTGVRSLSHRGANRLLAPLARVATWPGRAIRAIRRWGYLRNLDGDAAEAIADEYDEAETTYRTFEQLARENALPAKIPEQFVRGKDARRKQALADDKTWTWAWLATQRWITDYGQSPWRVMATSLVVILGCALLYPLLGGVALSPESETLTVFEPIGTPLDELPGGTWLASFYFSIVTFTTLGYGDVQPASAPAQLLAGVESLVGAALLALLVAVLARRITR